MKFTTLSLVCAVFGGLSACTGTVTDAGNGPGIAGNASGATPGVTGFGGNGTTSGGAVDRGAGGASSTSNGGGGSSTAGNGNAASGAGSTGSASGGASSAGSPSSAGVPGSSAGSIGFSGPASAASALRKVKNVLTGLAPTDAELAQASDSAGLRALIDGWMQTPEFQEKMIFFFQNAFQQSSLAVLDFEFQLRKRPGAFDLSYAIFGDSAFPMLFKNMKESFARTALALVASGRPFTDVLTTNQFMMTTALKSLYMQIEAPYDIHTMTFQYNHGMRPPIETSLTNMVFGYEAPTTSTGRKFTGTCAGDTSKVSTYPGNTYLFHILLGSVPRDSSNNSAGRCRTSRPPS